MTSHHAPRKAPPWFKFEARRTLTDPRLRDLTPKEFRSHVYMLCLAWEEDGLSEECSKFASLVGQRRDSLKRSIERVDGLGALWGLDENLRLRNSYQEVLREEWLKKSSKAARVARLRHAMESGLLAPASTLDDLARLDKLRGAE